MTTTYEVDRPILYTHNVTYNKPIRYFRSTINIANASFPTLQILDDDTIIKASRWTLPTPLNWDADSIAYTTRAITSPSPVTITCNTLDINGVLGGKVKFDGSTVIVVNNFTQVTPLSIWTATGTAALIAGTRTRVYNGALVTTPLITTSAHSTTNILQVNTNYGIPSTTTTNASFLGDTLTGIITASSPINITAPLYHSTPTYIYNADTITTSDMSKPAWTASLPLILPLSPGELSTFQVQNLNTYYLYDGTSTPTPINTRSYTREDLTLSSTLSITNDLLVIGTTAVAGNLGTDTLTVRIVDNVDAITVDNNLVADSILSPTIKALSLNPPYAEPLASNNPIIPITQATIDANHFLQVGADLTLPTRIGTRVVAFHNTTNGPITITQGANLIIVDAGNTRPILV